MPEARDRKIVTFAETTKPAAPDISPYSTTKPSTLPLFNSRARHKTFIKAGQEISACFRKGNLKEAEERLNFRITSEAMKNDFFLERGRYLISTALKLKTANAMLFILKQFSMNSIKKMWSREKDSLLRCFFGIEAGMDQIREITDEANKTTVEKLIILLKIDKIGVLDFLQNLARPHVKTKRIMTNINQALQHNAPSTS